MNLAALGQRLLPAALAFGLAAGAAAPVAAGPAAGAVPLAPHRAVYDLKLVKSHGSRGIDAVAGRILYDFSGNACDGYALDFRQVADMESGSGQSVVSDMRSTTWEDGKARSFRFNTVNKLNDRSTSRVDGSAKRGDKAVEVQITKPAPRTFAAPAAAVFPTDHMRRVIAAARAGNTLLSIPVYDGSDTGLKVYDTLTIIGKGIAPGEDSPKDAAAAVPAMVNLARWPVTISYFEQQGADKRGTGEQTPTYAISFELYENGVSRGLLLHYSDFTLSGEMTALTLKKPKPCK